MLNLQSQITPFQVQNNLKIGKSTRKNFRRWLSWEERKVSKLKVLLIWEDWNFSVATCLISRRTETTLCRVCWNRLSLWTQSLTQLKKKEREVPEISERWFSPFSKINPRKINPQNSRPSSMFQKISDLSATLRNGWRLPWNLLYQMDKRLILIKLRPAKDALKKTGLNSTWMERQKIVRTEYSLWN